MDTRPGSQLKSELIFGDFAEGDDCNAGIFQLSYSFLLEAFNWNFGSFFNEWPGRVTYLEILFVKIFKHFRP